jgi:hypothetical protein
VKNALTAALAQYGKQLGGTAKLNIQLKVADLGSGDDFATAGTPVFVPTGQPDPNNNRAIYQTAAQWMLNNPGKDPWQVPGIYVNPVVSAQPDSNGVKPDIVITLNANPDKLKTADLKDDNAPPSGSNRF